MTDPRVAIVKKWELSLDPYNYAGPDKCNELLAQLDAAMQSPEVVERVAMAIHDADDACPRAWVYLDEDVRSEYMRTASVALAAAVGGTKP